MTQYKLFSLDQHGHIRRPAANFRLRDGSRGYRKGSAILGRAGHRSVGRPSQGNLPQICAPLRS